VRALKINKGKWLAISTVVAVVGIVAGISYAAFLDTGKVLGSSFSVGSVDIKILKDLSQGIETSNLEDEINGPVFTNIGQNWQQDYPIKLFNNGTFDLQIASHANYETANDPDDLRQYIYAEIIPWDDQNSNGTVEQEELESSLGKKSIIKWKTEGYDLGNIEMGQVKGLVVRFSTDSLSDTKQGKTGVYDFEFDAIEL
jgi:hypothetical protein